jgi:ABC-type microcin C transport system duplicated ATPase subunit YejF
MIFQEPLLAFDPVYTVGQQIIEGLRRHEGLSRQAAGRALEALRQVRIPEPRAAAGCLPARDVRRDAGDDCPRALLQPAAAAGG